MWHLFLILFLFILLIYFESDQLVYHAKCAVRPSLNQAGLPTPSSIRTTILPWLDKPILIDFGCGDGDFISYAASRVKTTIGIELDNEQAQYAQHRFQTNPTITILSMNMKDYMFPTEPFIIYMYEPLWKMNREEAVSLYDEIVSRVPAHGSIIYVSAYSPLLDEAFFVQRNFHVVHKARARRILGWEANHMYYLSKTIK
jgi:hypothetical protein